MTEKEQLIKKFHEKRKEYNQAENDLGKYLESKFSDRVSNAKTIEELDDIQNEIKYGYPNSAYVTLMFVDINIMKNNFK